MGYPAPSLLQKALAAVIHRTCLVLIVKSSLTMDAITTARWHLLVHKPSEDCTTLQLAASSATRAQHAYGIHLACTRHLIQFCRVTIGNLYLLKLLLHFSQSTFCCFTSCMIPLQTSTINLRWYLRQAVVLDLAIWSIQKPCNMPFSEACCTVCAIINVCVDDPDSFQASSCHVHQVTNKLKCQNLPDVTHLMLTQARQGQVT